MRLHVIVGPCLLLWCAGCGAPPSPAASSVGQWVWTSRDSALLVESRAAKPELRAAIWVATLSRRGDSLVTSLGRPIDATMGERAEAVIRIDDSFSTLWETVPGDALADRVAQRIARILPLVDPARGSGQPARAIQLDYDAPVARLGDYARLIARLRAPNDGVLRDRSVWVTSLVAHLADPEYDARLRPWVDGHILQLFDTGERFDARTQRRVLARIASSRLPFRLGLGSFERRLSTGTTTHRDWFAIIPEASRSRWYRGYWIFPAGRPYLSDLLPR